MYIYIFFFFYFFSFNSLILLYALDLLAGWTVFDIIVSARLEWPRIKQELVDSDSQRYSDSVRNFCNHDSRLCFFFFLLFQFTKINHTQKIKFQKKKEKVTRHTHTHKLDGKHNCARSKLIYNWLSWSTMKTTSGRRNI